MSLHSGVPGCTLSRSQQRGDVVLAMLPADAEVAQVPSGKALVVVRGPGAVPVADARLDWAAGDAAVEAHVALVLAPG